MKEFTKPFIEFCKINELDVLTLSQFESSNVGSKDSEEINGSMLWG